MHQNLVIQPIQFLENEQLESMMVTTQSGQILYDQDSDLKTDPASLTKMMTVYLTLDAIENGKVKKDQSVKIDDTYESMSTIPMLSNVPLKRGDSYTIDQLVLQTLLKSSNAATLVLGDQISGSTSKFVDAMNQKAKKIGMKDTHFVNPTGATNELLRNFAPKSYKDENRTQTTSSDMSLLVHSLLKKHPEVLDYSSKLNDTQNGQTLTSINLGLEGQPYEVEGADGLKTGTNEKGYSLALTGKRGKLRLNEVIFNVQPYPSDATKANLYRIAGQVMDNAYDDYEYRKVVSKGKHKINDKLYEVEKDLYDIVPKGEKPKLKVTDDDRVYADYDREFIKGSKPPSVPAKKVNFFKAIYYNMTH
ncbi:DUF1958 domain-containing protein [Staphylococcus sp. 11262D007BW]